MKNKTFETAGQVLPRILTELKPPATAWLEIVRQRWNELAGTAIASQTEPKAIEGTTLVVHVKNHVWLAELQSGLGAFVQDRVSKEIAETITQIRWTTLSPEARW